MSESSGFEVIEEIGGSDKGFIENGRPDGFHASKFRELMLEEEPPKTVDHIMSNASMALSSLRDPQDLDSELDFHTVKTLCLGKVQSGKTSFFLATIAMAFDNGYDVAYLLGGTKLKLKKQNLGRVKEAFSNNEKIKIFDVKKGFAEDVKTWVSKGYKVILVVLKNASKSTNLGLLKDYCAKYESIPSIIVDDEGDEYTPGAPKAKKKNSKAGRTHDDLIDIMRAIRRCTFLSVTATPQANLLVSIEDGVSPDRIVMVEPGLGYTGGRQFFDTIDNRHIVRINDTDDFVDSIPASFKKALIFYIFACALKLSQGDEHSYSMLVHPSSFSRIQDIVSSRIHSYFDDYLYPAVDNQDGIEATLLADDIDEAKEDYLKANPDAVLDIEKIVEVLPVVIKGIYIQTINYLHGDYGDDEHRYKIKIGGNMLGRGLTIDRLIISYIYRDSNEAMVDTMYQRCRWFGYKASYFDVCRVYMTRDLQDKFIAIVDHEEYLWSRIRAFLDTETNAKKFGRVFRLNDDRLLLTRKTVSGTRTIREISGGHRADLCIDYSPDEKAFNRKLIDSFIKAHADVSELKSFSVQPNEHQEHLLIRTTFKEFFDEYLSKAYYGFRSPFTPSMFRMLITYIDEGLYPNDLIVMIMRYGKGELRSPNDEDPTKIDILFQGSNDNTHFTGDKYPIDIDGIDYTKIPFFQVHMIHILKMEEPYAVCFPLLSFNNPVTAQQIKMVTGDNYYGDDQGNL